MFVKSINTIRYIQQKQNATEMISQKKIRKSKIKRKDNLQINNTEFLLDLLHQYFL